MITRRSFGFGAFGLGAVTAFGSGGMVPNLARAAGPEGVTHGLSSFGALKYPADFAHFDYVNPDAPKGGTFSTAVPGITFDSLNPFVLKGNPAAAMTLCYDTLMTGAADEPDAVYGLLAETAELGPDKQSVAFTLRAEGRFADGSTVTPEDVVWTFEALMEKGHPSYRLQFAAVTGAEVTGEREVTFRFDPSFPLRDMPMSVAGLPVLARAWWEGRDFEDSTLDPFLGSGPYTVGEAEPGRRISYRRRDDYWARDLPVMKGRYNFDEIRLDYYRDRTAAFEGLKAGEYTFYEEFWSRLWANSYNFEAVQTGAVVKATPDDNRPAGTQGYWFNIRREKFANPKTRQAIAEMFDFEWSNKTLFFDLYDRTNSFFEGGGELEATGAPTPAELALLEPLAEHLPDGALEAVAYVPPVSDGSGRLRRQLRRSGTLLDEAGWQIVDGKRVNAAGEALEIEFLLVSEGFERITNPYAQNLERLGITATSRTVDPAQYKNRMDEFDFDATVDRKAMSLTPGSELRDYFHSASAASPGSQNTSGVANPAVDALIETIERAASREELVTAVNALDRVLRAMQIWVPQWSKASHHLAYWNVYGQPAIKPAYSRGVIDTWWIDEAKFAELAPQIGQ
ncbi:MAG: extracellular solute-binding protein [Pseudomonadota bacterium]